MKVRIVTCTWNEGNNWTHAIIPEFDWEEAVKESPEEPASYFFRTDRKNEYKDHGWFDLETDRTSPFEATDIFYSNGA